MKVRTIDKEITAYSKSLEIEVEGVTYHADLTYDSYSGYDLRFTDNDGKYIDSPQWAQNYEQKISKTLWRSLPYDLDEMSGNWEYARDVMKESV